MMSEELLSDISYVTEWTKQTFSDHIYGCYRVHFKTWWRFSKIFMFRRHEVPGSAKGETFNVQCGFGELRFREKLSAKLKW